MDTPTPEVISQETPRAPTAAKRRRRRYSKIFKQQIVAEVLAGHDSVSVIARRHDLNTNLVFKWKREQQRDGAEPTPNALIPVSVTSIPPVSGSTGRIDIELPTGDRISVYDDVSATTLQTVLSVLRS